MGEGLGRQFIRLLLVASLRRRFRLLREAGPVLRLGQNGLQGSSPDSFQSTRCQQRAGKYQRGRNCRRSWSSSSECVARGTSRNPSVGSGRGKTWTPFLLVGWLVVLFFSLGHVLLSTGGEDGLEMRGGSLLTSGLFRLLPLQLCAGE